MNKSEPPAGWFCSGSHPGEYWMGIDKDQPPGQPACATLKSVVSEPAGFGTLMQTIAADEYRGSRVRFSAELNGKEIGGWAGLWMRVDAQGKSVAFDNMQNRALTSTSDWTRNDIVLDVPVESDTISFGLLLSGPGQVWMKELRFERVGKDVPTTSSKECHPKHPVNLGFTVVSG